jgi:hypothetical protein
MNLKFEKGKLVLNENLQAFMIYDKEIKPERLINNDKTDSFNRKEINETVPYP